MVDFTNNQNANPEISQLENALTGHGELPPPGSDLVGLDPLGQALFLTRFQQTRRAPLLVVYGHSNSARNAIDNFRFFAGSEATKRVHFIPALEFDYHRSVLPNSEVVSERNVGFFHALNDPEGRIFVTTARALLQKAMPCDIFLGLTGIYKANDEVDRDTLILNLLKAGYQRQPTAYDPGVFAVRGGVVDIFSPLYPHPIRLEFFGDLIEEIRLFDAKSQLSQGKMDEVYVVPVSLSVIPSPEHLNTLSPALKDRLDLMGVSKQKREEVFESLRAGNLSLDSIYLYPLLSGGSTLVTDYFPKTTQTIWEGKKELLKNTATEELAVLDKNYEHFAKALIPIAEKQQLLATQTEIESQMQQENCYSFENFDSKSPSSFTLTAHALSFADERAQTQSKSGQQPSLEAFAKRFRDWMDEGYRLNIVTHTQVHADRIGLLFSPYGISVMRHAEDGAPWPELSRVDFTHLHVWQGFLTESRIYPGLKLVLINEEAIFGQKKRAAKSAAWVAQSDSGRVLASFRDLKVTDYVVHRDFGVGRYLGLKSMDFLGVPNDYVLLEYRDGDKLYIPVYRLNVLQKYVGGEGASVALDKLGGEAWTKAKKKAEKAIAELAAQFLTIQAKRKLVTAHAYSAPGNEYHQFEMAFPFDETPDQMRAIEDVMHDLGIKHPMDRLVCGDVGYGKTEVAMRAAYRVILDNKQVAVLVPTTVLAFQHFESFKTRFAHTGARIEMVSRFRSASETKRILAELKEGKIDILVGTHRLISNDIVFKDLGLLVIDEEHRFGVIHKERLKEMSAGVHVLSMTATPIPRTLNMAMTGIKEISIITTPPPDRLSVRTFVCRDSDEILTEAIQNELARDGQIFFVHNRIETIFGVEETLRRLFPKLKIAVVHGQMDAEELEKKMLGFYHGEFQLLLTTAIIESGLDIPRANTIILDQAHHLGLAQLYQLRGRVGRSSVRAYCYLLTPSESAMTKDAKERLQVIQRYTDLGSGFNIASHDLEIRGAGDLLGRDQSGHLNAIGVDLYFELLEESIRELRGQEKRINIEPEITMKVAAYFPNDYLPDVGERVALYRKLSSAEDEDAIAQIESEIRDRLGTPPEEVANLIGLMMIKLWLKRLHVTRMSCGPKRTSLQFADTTPASPEKLVKLIQSNSKLYSITPDQKFVFNADNSDWRAQLQQIQKLCGLLGMAG